jgi:hypothetical protein
MALPDYQLTIRSPYDGAVRTILGGSAFDDCKYSRTLNGVGIFAMTLPSDPDWPAIFTLDTLIDVERTSPLTGLLQVEDTYLTRLLHRFRDGDDERFVVGGLSLNHLLSRRLIDPNDDPLAAGGYSTKAGSADTVLAAYASEQCGTLASLPRQFSNFQVAAVGGIGSSVGRRLRYENLLETFQDIANQSNVDFIVNRLIANTLRLVILPIGTDKTRTRNYPFNPFVELNPIRGNLSDPSLLIDRKQEQNYVYALGQGPGESRIVFEMQGIGVNDSPYNRIEFTTDIRQAERGDSTNVATQARAALIENQPVKEFTFKPSGVEAGSLYRLDWDVGDILTCAWDNEILDLRVREVEITIDASGETITPKLEPV